jgi:hypothetical protein
MRTIIAQHRNELNIVNDLIASETTKVSDLEARVEALAETDYSTDTLRNSIDIVTLQLQEIEGITGGTVASNWTQDFIQAKGLWVNHAWASYVPSEGWQGNRSPGRTVYRLKVGISISDYSFPVSLIRLTVYNWWRTEEHLYPELAISLTETGTSREVYRILAPVATSPTNKTLTLDIPLTDITVAWGVQIFLANTNKDSQPVFLRSIEFL